MMKEHIQNSDMNNHEKKLILDLSSEPELDDIEKIYDCINRTIDVGGHYSRFITNYMNYSKNNVNMGYQNVIKTLETTKLIIRNILLESFKIESVIIPEIKAMYDRIWSVIQGNGSNTFQIITTNYDQVIEHYCDENWELVNGFNFASNSQHHYWKNKWEPSTNKQSLHLIKLHGSTAWQKYDNKIIQMPAPGIRNSDDDIMILPTLGPKDYKETPFSELKEQFEKILTNIDVLIIIGFSYRDPEINETIRKQMRRGMIVISISPEADQVGEISKYDGESVKIQGLPFTRFGGGIFACKKEFNPKSLDDICNAINVIFKDRQNVRK